MKVVAATVAATLGPAGDLCVSRFGYAFGKGDGEGARIDLN